MPDEGGGTPEMPHQWSSMVGCSTSHALCYTAMNFVLAIALAALIMYVRRIPERGFL